MSPEARPSNMLFSIGKSKYTVGDFNDYIKAHQTPQKYVTPQTYVYQLYETFEKEKVMDYADAHLEERYPEFKALVQEYNDGILLFDLMDKEVWSKAVSDTAGLRDFHSRNAEKYMWNDRVKACVITVNRPESLPKVMEYLEEGVPYDSLRGVIKRDSVNFVQVRNGFFQLGDNQYVDQTIWKAGMRKEFPSTVDNSTVIVNIIELRQPEPKTLGEARGLVTSDYQVELEQKWIERLREKYPVKIDQKVLEQVKALYQ
jgi:peptidyl-prolyl cis-trans isomerase SurA